MTRLRRLLRPWRDRLRWWASDRLTTAYLEAALIERPGVVHDRFGEGGREDVVLRIFGPTLVISRLDPDPDTTSTEGR